MLCRNPFTKGLHCYPCGQCMPCRLNRRKIWASRITLEAKLQPNNSFLTLTYNDSSLPRITSSGSVVCGLPSLDEHEHIHWRSTLLPKDLQDWLKRFRKAISPSKIRYFGVGEYGDESQRPHYHLAMFNYPHCDCHYANKNKKLEKWKWCSICRLPHETWGKGIAVTASLTLESAQYVAGYVTKKMTSADDIRLNGRHPEFARMSRAGGIGTGYLPYVLQTMMDHNLDDLQRWEGDVPVALPMGKKKLALGRFLRRKLRVMNGMDEKAPAHVIEKQEAEMRNVYETKVRSSKEFVSIKEAVVAEGTATVMRMEAQQKIHKKRRHL